MGRKLIPGEYDYIAINPYKANECLAVWSDHTISWNLPPSFVSMIGAALEWFGATNDDTTRAKLRDAFTADTPPSGANTPHSSFSPAATQPRPARPQSAQAAPHKPVRPYWSHQTGHVAQPSPNSGAPLRPPMTHGYSSPSPSTYGRPSPSMHSTPPPSTYPSPPPSTPVYAPQSPYSTWAQDASTNQFLEAARFWREYWSNYAQNAANINQAVSGGFGNGGGLNFGPMSMFNSNPLFSLTAFGGDPTAGLGGDPTGGLFTGSAFPMDPSSMLSGLGMDPVSMMSGGMGMAGGMGAGCSGT